MAAVQAAACLKAEAISGLVAMHGGSALCRRRRQYFFDQIEDDVPNLRRRSTVHRHHDGVLGVVHIQTRNDITRIRTSQGEVLFPRDSGLAGTNQGGDSAQPGQHDRIFGRDRHPDGHGHLSVHCAQVWRMA
jgi:hypothetical protein